MWARLLTIAIGIWLMAAPGVLHSPPGARASEEVAGPLAAAFGCIAIWDATRPLRWLNLPIGAWLILSPWVLGYGWPPALHATVAGLALAALAFVRGRITHRYGGGWSVLWEQART